MDLSRLILAFLNLEELYPDSEYHRNNIFVKSWQLDLPMNVSFLSLPQALDPFDKVGNFFEQLLK